MLTLTAIIFLLLLHTPYSASDAQHNRHLALAGSHGHVATFDWQAGRLHSEIQLGETVRDIK
jgi:U3 small nucleolar RNA-associated protein 7